VSRVAASTVRAARTPALPIVPAARVAPHGQLLYKVVAVVNDKFYSVFEGRRLQYVCSWVGKVAVNLELGTICIRNLDCSHTGSLSHLFSHLRVPPPNFHRSQIRPAPHRVSAAALRGLGGRGQNRYLCVCAARARTARAVSAAVQTAARTAGAAARSSRWYGTVHCESVGCM
jgi:hypothetical protein